MTLRLLCFSMGIMLVGYFPTLPSLASLFVSNISIFMALFALRRKLTVVFSLAALLLGFNYGVISGSFFINQQLSNDLVGLDLAVEGRVVNLPQENNRRQLFTLDVDAAYSLHESTTFKNFPRKINVSSYGALRVKPGERWHLVVKLKKPRGFVNPGGFDYQASLLRHGVGATGYIREGDNHLLQNHPDFSVDVIRYKLQQWLIRTSQSSQKSILVALLVGDTSLVDKNQWGEMIKTGTNHLIAISGLHLGFFAIVGFFVGNLIGRCTQLFSHKFPSMVYGHCCSIVFTLSYSLIAGFNIPTVRTLIMLAVVQLALVWRRSFRVRDTLLIALVLVLLYDPLAAYDMGFWLSFSAVAMLIFSFSGRLHAGEFQSYETYTKHIAIFIKSQWVMFVGLLIPLAVLIHSSSLIAPLANAFAIPAITFFVVPCLILSALAKFLFNSFLSMDGFFLHCAELGVSLVHEWLSYLLKIGDGKFNPLLNINSSAIFLAVPAVFIILLPRGLGSKQVGYAALLLSLLIPLKQLPDLQLLVFDVGQGTAVLVRTPHHQLLYDTGPLYTENFDAGSGIIVPYLQSQGIGNLDALVVSHNDQDHSGGLAGVLAATQVEKLLLGEPDKYKVAKTQNCHEQPAWQWEDVHFSFITWPVIASEKANNHSCVLMIEYKNQKIILAGDIEKEVEQVVISQQSLSNVDILLAPHHGSHTSSTAAFVEHLKPKYIVYSAGYMNQHGHPHKDVQARYENIGSIPLNTAYDGAVEFTWENQAFNVRAYRLFSHRYWFE